MLPLDDGPGLPPPLPSTAFERFTQSAGTNTVTRDQLAPPSV